MNTNKTQKNRCSSIAVDFNSKSILFLLIWFLPFYQTQSVDLQIDEAELLFFKGTSNGCEVQLDWELKSATNFSHFELEWCNDNSNYKLIKKIKSQTDFASTQPYSYVDEVASIENYYRLKMIAVDGSHQYSEVVKVTTACESKHDISLYPNPLSVSQGLINVRFYAEAEEEEIVVVDNVRQVVRRLNISVEKGWNTMRMELSDLPTGIYFVKSTTNTKPQLFVIQD